jgi:parvulin-like peptidyl-prolyl isomerase
MIATSRQLSILAGVAGALLLATLLLYGVERKPAVEAQKGGLLVQGLDLDRIARIALSRKDKTVTLVKQEDHYAVAERKGYPASVKKVNDLLVEVLGIRIAAKVTTSAANHAELGVVPGGDETIRVAFEDKDGKPLVAVLVGKSVPSGGGRYVRLDGQSAVYESEKGLWLDVETSAHLDRDLVDVKKDDVERVAVTLPDGRYAIAHNADKKIVLDAVPEGRKQKDGEVESAFDALAAFSVDDVVTEEPTGLAFDATYVCETKKHHTYTVRLAKQGDKHFARVACQGPPAAEVDRASRIGKDEPKEKLEEKATILTAVDTAAAFNKKHGPWLYTLSSWKAEKMRKPVKDLTEEKPRDAEPEEIGARHILVAYKGAERADARVVRTREDAKARAEELLKKVQAKDADFAAIAKQESDCPSRDKGGDLGTFKKGTLHKDFDAAAWKLKVDETSGVVETPFGFHIIRRTK